MKKITIILLVLCMILPSFASCAGGSGEETTAAEIPVETTLEETTAPVPTGIILASNGASDYVIVRPTECQSFILDAMSDLRKTVADKYGVTLKPQDDWVKGLAKGETYTSEAPEILIGETNRPESIEVLASLQPGEYKVCVSGNKLVLIGTTDYLTGLAVQEFVKYVKESAEASELTVSNDYTVLKSQDDFNKILMGITMYAMGDSYFGGSSLGKEATWVNMLGEKYGMDYVNYGIGGSTMSDYVTDKNPMVLRYTRMAKGDADVILLEGGRNDRSKEVPIGDLESRDSKTFLGSINIMLDGMLKTYPNALIILVTPWYHTGKVAATGLSNVDYANAMRSLAEHRNDKRIVCLYAADPSLVGVDMNNASFRAKYCIKDTDVSHLNLDGMKMVLPFMEQFIASEYAKFKGQ
ncbi:MAG: SGNH/GDSL hydrolase family protein [Clostridia bacterium]|nr:SGNH/GDSL hydrolase family protein [Clostridia bacterium]